MHVVMAIGRRRTKAMIADVCIKFEVFVYKMREEGVSTLSKARGESGGFKNVTRLL